MRFKIVCLTTAIILAGCGGSGGSSGGASGGGNNGTVASLTIYPENQLTYVFKDNDTIHRGNTIFTAKATYKDGTTENVTNSVEWKSSDTSIAAINNKSDVESGVGVVGFTIPYKDGKTQISASFKGVTSNASTLEVQARSDIRNITVCNNANNPLYLLFQGGPDGASFIWKEDTVLAKICQTFNIDQDHWRNGRLYLSEDNLDPNHEMIAQHSQPTTGTSSYQLVEFTFKSKGHGTETTGVNFDYSAVDFLNAKSPLGVAVTNGSPVILVGKAFNGYTGDVLTSQYDMDLKQITSTTEDFLNSGWPYFSKAGELMIPGGYNFFLLYLICKHTKMG